MTVRVARTRGGSNWAPNGSGNDSNLRLSIGAADSHIASASALARHRLASRRFHPNVVQEGLGHSSIGVTLDIYGSVLPTKQREAVERLVALIEPR